MVSPKLVYCGSKTAGFDWDRCPWASMVVLGEGHIKRASAQESFHCGSLGVDF